MGHHVHTRAMAAFSPGQRAAAEAFKTARANIGLSQRRLAERAGVAVGVIQNFEAKNTWPDDIRRAKLEGAVKLPAGQLARIAASYEGRGYLIDEENWLRRRLAEVQQLLRDGQDYPSRETAERLRRQREAELDPPGIPDPGLKS
jgi:transcriptional regulator with XRE-family HTH domain